MSFMSCLRGLNFYAVTRSIYRQVQLGNGFEANWPILVELGWYKINNDKVFPLDIFRGKVKFIEWKAVKLFVT
jgi:hypothetical protein